MFGKSSRNPVVPVVSLKGTIMSGSRSPFSGGDSLLNIDTVKDSLTKAFNRAGAVAVALDINSPGGSPTQSELIAATIRQLSKEKGIPVIAFTQDLAASGGYWLACAADEIYAAKTSTVGSIGVVTQSYGLPALFEKLGIEERTYTAGTAKRRITMGAPVKPEDEAWLRDRLEKMHTLFKDWIVSRRGDRLVIPEGQDRAKYLDEKVFTGDTWYGQEAKDMGLVDGVGYLEPVLKEKFGANVAIEYIQPRRRSLMSALNPFSRAAAPVSAPAQIGQAAVEAAAGIMLREAIWGPYDLK